MRPMKFRAWDIDNEKMVEWEGMYGIARCEKGRDDGIAVHVAIGDHCYLMPEQMILMQFTGLLDKKGREIYEGDIVVTDDYPFYSEGFRNYVGIIEWLDQDLCWIYELEVVSDRVCGRAVGGMLSDLGQSIEVIGNIYEHSELNGG